MSVSAAEDQGDSSNGGAFLDQAAETGEHFVIPHCSPLPNVLLPLLDFAIDLGGVLRRPARVVVIVWVEQMFQCAKDHALDIFVQPCFNSSFG